MSKTGAIYLRLSRDDCRDSESESITSQRLFLQQYAEKHNIRIGFEYIDDGVSGTSWQRRALQELLKAISSGRIDTVLVKDLSRLSRDYLRTGELLERWFPAHGVRLIAVNDGVDTGADTAMNDFFPIRAVMDEWYARDISRKVRAAIHARQQAGFCTAAHLPFGYRRSGGSVLICPDQAETVRKIFLLYDRGDSCCRIAKQLTHLSLPSASGKTKRWNDATVRRILQNPAYIGLLHLHKTEKCSYKSTEKRFLCADDAIIYRIPPMIEEEQFWSVQQKLRQSAHQKRAKDWLSGLVRCAECGCLMHCCGGETGGRLICGGRKRRSSCKNPSVKRNSLLDLILSQLRFEGIAVSSEQLPELVSSIAISSETVIVFLRCRRENAQNLSESGAHPHICAQSDM